MQHHTLEQTIHNDIFIWLLTYVYHMQRRLLI